MKVLLRQFLERPVPVLTLDGLLACAEFQAREGRNLRELLFLASEPHWQRMRRGFVEEIVEFASQVRDV